MFANNESTIDRLARGAAGTGLLVASCSRLGLRSARALGILSALVGTVLLFTAVLGSCPAYRLAGIDTSK